MFWSIIGIDDWAYEVIDAVESNGDKVLQVVYNDPLKADIPGYHLTPLAEFKPQQGQYFLSKGVGPWLFEKLKLNYDSIIHKTAWVGKTVKYGKGNFFGAGVVIATNVKLGSHNYFNRSCSVGHDTVMGNRNIVSPGATICGACEIGDDCTIAAGSTIRERLKLHSNTFVAAGAVLVEDTTDRGMWMGTPARRVPCPRCDPGYVI